MRPMANINVLKNVSDKLIFWACNACRNWASSTAHKVTVATNGFAAAQAKAI